MRNKLGVLADRIVGLVVPRTTAGACACNGCEYERVQLGLCASGCAHVCRGCNCNMLSYTCQPTSACSI